MSQKQTSNLNEKGKLNIYQNLIEKKDKSLVQFHRIKHINFNTNYLINKNKKEEKRYFLGFNNISHYSRKEITNSKKKNLYIQTNFDSKELPNKNDKRKIEQINYKPSFTQTYSKTKILPNERYNKNNINNLLKESTQDLIDLINTNNNNLDNNNRKRNMNTHNHSLYISNNNNNKTNKIDNKKEKNLKKNNNDNNNNKNQSSSFSNEVSKDFKILELNRKLDNFLSNQNEIIKNLTETNTLLSQKLMETKNEKKSELTPDNVRLILKIMDSIKIENNSLVKRIEEKESNLLKKFADKIIENQTNLLKKFADKIIENQTNLMKQLADKISENQTNLVKKLFERQKQENSNLIQNIFFIVKC